MTGATGYIGSELLRMLPDEENQIIPIGFSNTHIHENVRNVDLTDFIKTNQYIKSVSPDIILHLAGSKDMAKCEADKIFSRRINFEASENIISQCFENKIKLIYISTDAVFDGVHKHDELSVAVPTTQYGKDKLATENLIRNNLIDFVIVRIGGIFGTKNDFVDEVYTKLKREGNFHAYVNLINNPTYIGDLCNMLRIIIEKEHRGIFHCAGSESLSRYDFALKIAEHFNFDTSLIIPEELDLSKDIRLANLSMDCIQTYTTLNYYPQSISKILKSNSVFDRKA